MNPSISMETGISVYTHCSPSGSFECEISGLRWVCAEDVTLQFNFCRANKFRDELAVLQYVPIGPLMDIKVLSGKLLEAHLPHFACLGDKGQDSSLKKAVRVLHEADGGITLDTCELTRFHAKLLNPSFSLTEVLVRIGIPMKSHLEVLLFLCKEGRLKLHTYVMPWNASVTQSLIETSRQEHVKQIKKPQPEDSLWINSKMTLTTSCESRITPDNLTLNFDRPNFFEVYIAQPLPCVDLELTSCEQSFWGASSEKSVWTVPLWQEDYEDRAPEVRGAAGQLANLSLDDPRLVHMSCKDQLQKLRIGIIEGLSEGVLRLLLEALKNYNTPVLQNIEADTILQSTGVLSAQVTSLVDSVWRKGEKASGVLLKLIKQHDPYLYDDILRKMLADLN